MKILLFGKSGQVGWELQQSQYMPLRRLQGGHVMVTLPSGPDHGQGNGRKRGNHALGGGQRRGLSATGRIEAAQLFVLVCQRHPPPMFGPCQAPQRQTQQPQQSRNPRLIPQTRLWPFQAIAVRG